MSRVADWRPPSPESLIEGGAAPDTDGPLAPRDSAIRVAAALAALVAIAVASRYALLFVVVLIFCIFLHELGHYVTARWAGMKVTQFFIGFGPRIWSIQRGEVEYGFRAVPLGAFVRIIGMHNLEEVDPADEPRTYRQKGFWRRLSVAVAGSTMHFIIALLALFATLSLIGRATSDSWRVNRVEANSAAAAVGLQPGDKIVAVNGIDTPSFEKAAIQLRAHPDQQVTVAVLRGGSSIVLNPTLGHNAADPTSGLFGFTPEPVYRRQSLPSATGQSFVEFGRLAKFSVVGLGQVFSPGGITDYVDTLAGNKSTDKRLLSPIGAVRLGASAARNGAADFLQLVIAMNVFIGLFNLFPLLPFDGGHVVIAGYEAVRSRRGRRYYADVARMMPFSYAIMAVMLLLLLGNSYLDIFKFKLG